VHPRLNLFARDCTTTINLRQSVVAPTHHQSPARFSVCAMGRSTIPPALNELSNPSTPEAQVAALQTLKNEIVGHEQRKELAVTHGVVKPLAGLLRAEARKGGKRRRNNATNGHSSSLFSETVKGMEEWTTEDELRFQATLVVGSLANGERATPESSAEWKRVG